MPVQYRRTVDDAWRRLRSLRHDPPPHADRGRRKALFTASLEQSEQLFRAADGVGYETKPILLYYGLNQASRAVLAAKRDPKQQGAPSSHGVKTPNLDQDPKVGDLELADDGTSGSFAQLADVLGSPTLPGRVPLRQLWISLPEGVELPPTSADKLFGAALLQRADSQKFSDQFRETTGRVAKLAHLPFLLAPLDVAEAERQIIERYPALGNFHVIPNRQHCPEVAHWVQLLDPPGLRLSLSFDRGSTPMKHDEVWGMVHLGPRTYADYTSAQLWIPPTLPGNSAPLHPLVTWSGVLFALSMLARYQPTNWARSISIDTSADATALEHLMDTAHLACVNLIAGLFAVEHPARTSPTSCGSTTSGSGHGRCASSRRGRSPSGCREPRACSRAAAAAEAGIPSRRRACLGADQGQASRWSTLRLNDLDACPWSATPPAPT